MPTTDLWTPGSPPSGKGSGLQIVLPRGVERRKVWHCEICGSDFDFRGHRKFERHVVQCAKTHEDEIAEEMHNREQDVMHSREHMEEYTFKRRKAIEKGVKGKGLN